MHVPSACVPSACAEPARAERADPAGNGRLGGGAAVCELGPGFPMHDASHRAPEVPVKSTHRRPCRHSPPRVALWFSAHCGEMPPPLPRQLPPWLALARRTRASCSHTALGAQYSSPSPFAIQAVALDALADIDMLADADMFVLLLRSCFARVAYALAMGRRGRPPPVISLEAPWSPAKGDKMRNGKAGKVGKAAKANRARKAGGASWARDIVRRSGK